MSFRLLAVVDHHQRQQRAFRDDRSVLARTELDRSVLQPPAELLACRFRVLLEPLVELQHLGFDLIDAREAQWLARGLLDLFDRGAFLLRERLQVVERVDDVLRPVTAREEVDEAGHLLFGTLQALTTLAEIVVELLRVVAQLFGDAAPHVGDAFRREQALADGVEDLRACDVLANALAVGADAYALRLVRLAAVVAILLATHHRHRATALAAHQDPREQIRRALERQLAAVPLLTAHVALLHRREARLHFVPEIAIDDRQLGTLLRNDLGCVARAWLALVRARNLHPLALLELPDAGVTLVVENRADRRSAPAEVLVARSDARRRDAGLVQSVRDRVERSAITRLAEDAHDDLRFCFVDLDPVADHRSAIVDHRHRVIAVRDVAGRETGERAAFEPAQRLVSQIVEVQIRDEALHGERELRVLLARVDAVRDADERHLLELEALEDQRGVREVARDARHVLGDDRFDRARVDRGHHGLEAGTIEAGARDREIGEHLRRVGVRALEC